MTRRAMGLADNARCVIGCRLTQATRVHDALDDAAGKLCQALRRGAPPTPAAAVQAGAAGVAAVAAGCPCCLGRRVPRWEAAAVTWVMSRLTWEVVT